MTILRDLNFEYKAGKVPDADYASMKLSLEEEAAAILVGNFKARNRAPARDDTH